jgi:hypothetical protein
MTIKQDIIKTISYGKKFGGGMSFEELNLRLISPKRYGDEEIKEGIKYSKLKKNENIWRIEKQKLVKYLAKKIEKKFKDILFLGISGSVAAGYPKKNSDIDIFIITKKDRLWWNRLVLRWWIFKNKIPHRRFGQKERKNQFCFNLWLDENNLELKKEKQNLKNATDLIMMISILNRKKTYEKFLMKNGWVKNYLATGFYKKTKEIKLGKNDFGTRQNYLDLIVNYLVFWPQYWYMRKKIKREKVGLGWAFFHR